MLSKAQSSGSKYPTTVILPFDYDLPILPFHFRMIPTSSNRGLKESSTTPRLQTSLGKFSKLSTENRLLSRSTKSSAATEATVASLASKRRQELLSSLITEKRQKINLDLSNRLLNLNLKLQSKPSSSTEAVGLTGLNLSR